MYIYMYCLLIVPLNIGLHVDLMSHPVFSSMNTVFQSFLKPQILIFSMVDHININFGWCEGCVNRPLTLAASPAHFLGLGYKGVPLCSLDIRVFLSVAWI